MMMPWGSAFAVNNLHVTYEQLPVLFMVGGVASLIIMPLIGKLSDKIDKEKIYMEKINELVSLNPSSSDSNQYPYR